MQRPSVALDPCWSTHRAALLAECRRMCSHERLCLQIALCVSPNLAAKSLCRNLREFCAALAETVVSETPSQSARLEAEGLIRRDRTHSHVRRSIPHRFLVATDQAAFNRQPSRCLNKKRYLRAFAPRCSRSRLYNARGQGRFRQKKGNFVFRVDMRAIRLSTPAYEASLYRLFA